MSSSFFNSLKKHIHTDMSSVTVLPRVKRNARPSGFAAYAKAISKYNIDTSVLVAHNGKVYKRRTAVNVVSLRKHHGRHHHHAHPGDSDTVDEVPAKDIQGDTEYDVPVTIGTPGVTLNLDFDTGSSDLWVWSSELTVSKSSHTIYNPKNSSTAKEVKGATWNIGYGDGSGASGNVFTDGEHIVLRISSLSDVFDAWLVRIGSITIPNQGIELAEKLSDSFLRRGGPDGLLGLAWPSLNTVKPQPVATPVENIISQGIAPGVFRYCLPPFHLIWRLKNAFNSVCLRKDADGFYTFGGIDAARAGVDESQIQYADIDNSQGFWMVNSESIIINGETVSQPGNAAILDTGTTLCLLADEVVQQIYQQIDGAKFDNEQGGYIYPTGSKVPQIELFIGDIKITLNAEDFDFEVSSGLTFGGIQSRGNNPFDIMGDVVLKSIYPIFDQDNVRVGIAQRTTN
ncbi:hypothetical protein Clacol_004080 [Clathrus columnatus]|uniref:Peptidase A1 domain-containing protein n=1 Tax=Clathrus columnatus TaxID=1419009 RepID=A0AAV5A5D6_9AGAM|nr:hypothetical protein Clacol_004080 [Clathrus columnatus]